MLKVLHVIQGCGGGVASLIGNLVRSADKTRIKQDVLSFSYENGETFVLELEENGGKRFLLPRPRKEGYKAFRSYMLEVLRKGHYDVVHCHTDGWRTILYREITKKAGVPLFCIHAHRASNDPGVLGQSRIFVRLSQAISRKNADIRFACGVEAAKFIFGESDNCVVVPNGISLAHCEQAVTVDIKKKKRELGIPENHIVILQAGRLVTQKNYDFTVEIADELKRRGIRFNLMIAGTGSLEQHIQDKLDELSLSDQVELMGRRDDIYELMAVSDVMILPSLYEGLPTVVVEAQAMGLHSVVADTVTDECDMSLGLVHRVPIDRGVDCWIDAILNSVAAGKPTRNLIEQKLIEREYTDVGAAQTYVDALDRMMAEKAR